MSKGIVTVDDVEQLLEEAKADSRLSFTTKQQLARKPQGRLTTNKESRVMNDVSYARVCQPAR